MFFFFLSFPFLLFLLLFFSFHLISLPKKPTSHQFHHRQWLPQTPNSLVDLPRFSLNNPFFIIKAFAVGVILPMGFIHVLLDTTENSTSSCLSENPWDKFPFAGWLVMATEISTLMVDMFTTSRYTKSHLHKTHESNYVNEEKT
ncbi:hypothetical protein J1N35_010738 [Gossypium stocksii]|uniref:Uncharacterized protein n=1 Tax=Gossypium stocksii TaxID=47602 RepID=A0A9D3W2W1_9ROSI|nr:hypothetical protein J1N35_010738 [Gossypium stocksii]